MNIWLAQYFSLASIHVDEVRLRLTKKIALCVNGVDLTHLHVGDIMELDYGDARMMIDCCWAQIVPLDTPLMHPIFHQIPAGPQGKLTGVKFAHYVT